MERKSATISTGAMKVVYHKTAVVLVLLVSVVSLAWFFMRLFMPHLSLFMIPDFGISDVLHLNLPLKEFLSQSLKSGQWPLWSSGIGSGFPVLAEGQIGTFFIPNLLLFRFFPTVIAFNISLIVSYIFLYLGTYLSLRMFRYSVLSSLLSSYILMFCGFFAVHLNHTNLIQTASLFPLLFWSIQLLRNHPTFRHSCLISLIMSQQIFAGHFYVVMISWVGIFIYLLTMLISTHKKTYAYLFVGILLGFSLAAIQILPTFELLQKSSRNNGLDFDIVTSLPFPPKHILSFLDPYIFGTPADGSYPHFNGSWGIFWENTAYLGLLPLLASALSIIHVRNKRVTFGWILLCTSILLVLGKYSPLYFIFSIPPFTLFRVPSKYLLLTLFALVLLTTETIEALIKKLRTPAHILLLTILLLSAQVYTEYIFSYTYPPVSEATWWTKPPTIIQDINSPGRILSIAQPTAWNAVFLKQGWKHISEYRFLTNLLYPNYLTMFSLNSPIVYTGGLIPRRTQIFQDMLKNQIENTVDTDTKIASISALSAHIIQLSNVTHIISAAKLEASILSLEKTYPNPTHTPTFPIYLYQVHPTRPRVYLAYRSNLVTTTAEAYTAIIDPSFIASKTILVEDSHQTLSGNFTTGGSVRLTQQKDTSLRMEVTSPTDAILVVGDSFYPGWKAFIDNNPTELFVVNLNQRGIRIQKGAHRLSMIYEPDSFVLGRRITYMSMLIVSAAVLISSFAPRRKDV